MSMLKEIPLFQGLNEEQLNFLTPMISRFTYPKGSVLITQGEHSTALFIVIQGELKVTAVGPEGKQTLLAFLGKNSFVGELSLLDDGPRSATVQTTVETETLLITQDVFNRFVESFPEALLPMLRIMASRLRDLDDMVCSLATLDVYGRVCKHLLKYAKEENGILVVQRRFTQEEIAEMIGSSREMVSRIMQGLSFGGYIDYDGRRRIMILNKLPERW